MKRAISEWTAWLSAIACLTLAGYAMLSHVTDLAVDDLALPGPVYVTIAGDTISASNDGQMGEWLFTSIDRGIPSIPFVANDSATSVPGFSLRHSVVTTGDRIWAVHASLWIPTAVFAIVAAVATWRLWRGRKKRATGGQVDIDSPSPARGRGTG